MRSFMPVLSIVLASVFASPGHSNDAYFDSAQDTIRSQLEAFLANDGTTAYSFAATNIKRIFPTQEAFMRMVRTAYPQVHSPRDFSFGKAELTGPNSLIQQVMIVGPDGREYEAIYTLQVQDDGSLKITGVHLRAASTIGA
jgi:hypothetical protein